MHQVVRPLITIIFFLGLSSCGVKKAPTPLYSIPDTALKTTPTPTPTIHE